MARHRRLPGGRQRPARLAGEIDYIEQPPHDLLPLLKSDPNIKIWVWSPRGNQYVFRPNHLHKPFDDPRVRRALWFAFNQEDFSKAVVGDPAYYQTCKAMFVCGTALASESGMDGLLTSNFEKARSLLKEAGYDGTPIVLMHSTDLYNLTNLAPVAKQLMEQAGFRVDMQSMDWQTLVARRAKKDPPSSGGWNAFLTSSAATDVDDPILNGWLNSGCDKALPGWPCDAEMENLRLVFARETDPAKQKALADSIQLRATEWTQYIHLGQWYPAAPSRRNIGGILAAGVRCSGTWKRIDRAQLVRSLRPGMAQAGCGGSKVGAKPPTRLSHDLELLLGHPRATPINAGDDIDPPNPGLTSSRWPAPWSTAGEGAAWSTAVGNGRPRSLCTLR